MMDEYLVVFIFVDVCFHFCGVSGIAQSYDEYISNDKETTKLFSKVIVPYYTSTS